MSNYTLAKGNHYASGLHFGVHFGIKEQSYKVRFSKECLYTPLDWENDYNKLCGWSYGMHHNNSIRVCWRPSTVNTTQIELCLYVYENTVRKISGMTILVNVEQDYELDLEIQDAYQNIITQQLFLTVKGSTYGLSMEYKTKPSWGYRLYPFFGGNGVSPHDMVVQVEKV